MRKTELAGTVVEDGIAEHIQGRILAGYIPPGTKLGEEVLSDIYSISRSRIRQVLQRLAWSRLVDQVPNRGAFFADPSPKEAADILAARRAIESVTTEIAARTILTHRLVALRKHRPAGVRAYSALMSSQRRERIELAGEFHRLLAQSVHSSALSEALEPLILRTALVMASYPEKALPFDFAAAHSLVLDEIEAGQSRRAGLCMERCLFGLEASVDLRRLAPQPVNLAAVLRVLG
jgi:DNA-binding GntR family transcriptional regulator